VTEAIWRDMPSFDGYLSHELLIDSDDPGHLLVISQWTTREHADATLRAYAAHPNAQAANRLVSEPRRRIVAARADVAPR
jgi:quinol monooxygenase YgiN